MDLEQTIRMQCLEIASKTVRPEMVTSFAAEWYAFVSAGNIKPDSFPNEIPSTTCGG